MINRLAHVCQLYARNPLFAVLSITLIFSAVLSKVLLIRRAYISAEEVWNVMFVAMLWIIFYLGVLVKQQIATHRATLLPGYRWPHIIVMTAIAAVLLGVGMLWNQGIVWGYDMSPAAINGGYACCVLAGVVILGLGYLSMGRLLLYAYGLTIFAALNAELLISVFEARPFLVFAVVGLCAGLFAALIGRLLILKADHFEYPCVFSWPPKAYMARLVHRSVSPRFLRLFPVKNSFPQVSCYTAHQSFLDKVFHWDPLLKRNIRQTLVAVSIATPVYAGILYFSPDVREFFSRAYVNFLLLALTPVLATLIGQYKKIAYWEYDLLRPVTRLHYIKERGTLLVIHLLAHWLLVVWFIALVPVAVFQPAVLATVKFWLYLSLTGLGALLVLAWLAALSCTDKARIILGNGLILGVTLLFFVYYTESFTTGRLAVANIFMLAGTMLFLRGAVRGWALRERL